MTLHITYTVCGVIAPLALNLVAGIDGTVMLLDVFVQTVLSQTRQVAVDTVDHGTTCQRKVITMVIDNIYVTALCGRSFVCTVCAAVIRQITELSERLTADVTDVRSLICMYTAVMCQTAEVSERLTADVTAVGSLICVYAAVTRQTTDVGERLTADVTAVRSLICVYRWSNKYETIAHIFLNFCCRTKSKIRRESPLNSLQNGYIQDSRKCILSSHMSDEQTAPHSLCSAARTFPSAPLSVGSRRGRSRR